MSKRCAMRLVLKKKEDVGIFPLMSGGVKRSFYETLLQAYEEWKLLNTYLRPYLSPRIGLLLEIESISLVFYPENPSEVFMKVFIKKGSTSGNYLPIIVYMDDEFKHPAISYMMTGAQEDSALFSAILDFIASPTFRDMCPVLSSIAFLCFSPRSL